MRKSTIKDEVLREISKGKVISGGFLSSRLGVSRTAVWKTVNALRAEGYFISGLGGGYVLAPENSRVCGEQLRVCTGENIIFKDVTVSTNEDIKALAGSGTGEFTVAAARRQTGGKGRKGRTFLSPDGGLYFSVLLRPSFSAGDCLKITTAAAVAVAGAIEEVTGLSAKIKWVNDIIIKNRKVCGILTEGEFDAETGGLKYAVLGIGINVATPKGGFEDSIADTAGALFETGSVPSLVYCALLSGFFKRFRQYYGDIKDISYLEEYRRRSYLTGKTVTYIKDSKEHTGEVCGISDNAELIVKENGKRKEIFLSSGQVQITDYE